MSKPGTQSGAVEHKFRGRTKIMAPKLDRDDLELLRQEAVIRVEFGEDGVRRFWQELERRELTNERD